MDIILRSHRFKSLVYADLSQFKTNDRDKNILTIISESKIKVY